MAQLGTRRWIGFFVTLFSACGDRGDCPTGVDALLAQVEESAPGRVNCGSFHASSFRTGRRGEVDAALDCFLPADEEGAPARELTINRCIDCFMQSTYVVTSEGELFHVRRTGDQYDGQRREVQVERCSALVMDAQLVIRCEGAELLYVCEDKPVRR
jgi:hypothetical protein